MQRGPRISKKSQVLAGKKDRTPVKDRKSPRKALPVSKEPVQIKSKLSRRTSEAVSKLYNWNSKREEKWTAMKREVEQEHSFRPQINEVSKMIVEEPRRPGDLEVTRTRNTKVAESKSFDQFSFTPRINQRSSKLA